MLKLSIVVIIQFEYNYYRRRYYEKNYINSISFCYHGNNVN